MPAAARKKTRRSTKGTGQNQGRKVVLTNDQLRQVQTMASIGCTHEEIYGVLGISQGTWEKLLKKTFDYQPPIGPEDEEPPAPRKVTLRGLIERGQANLRTSIRRFQYRAASQGKVGALVWLGKQYLGQRDVRAIEIETPGGGGGGLNLRIEAYDPEKHGGGNGNGWPNGNGDPLPEDDET